MRKCPQCGIRPEVELYEGPINQILIYCPSCRHSGDGSVQIGCHVDDDDGSIAAEMALGFWNALPPMQEAA